MKKYYIGFLVLLAVCVGTLVYAVSQGGDAKTDSATSKVVEEMSIPFDGGDYSYDKPVPASLAGAGIKNVPSTVTYTKLSDSKYKVCFDYKDAAGGFDAGWAGLFTGNLGGSDQTTYTDSASNDGYFDSSVEFTHKKGENCQTVTTAYSAYSQYSYNNYNGDTGSSSGSGGGSASIGCQNTYSSLTFYTIASIDTANKQIGFKNSPSNSDTKSIEITRKYDDSTVICDSTSQTQISVSDLQVGEEVYIDSSATNATLIIIYAYPSSIPTTSTN